MYYFTIPNKFTNRNRIFLNRTPFSISEGVLYQFQKLWNGIISEFHYIKFTEWVRENFFNILEEAIDYSRLYGIRYGAPNNS